LLTKRDLSTQRYWSSRIRAGRPSKRICGLQPSGWPLLVNGATISRGNAAFRSSGEITNPGRVFLIAVPSVGASEWVTRSTDHRASGVALMSQSA